MVTKRSNYTAGGFTWLEHEPPRKNTLTLDVIFSPDDGIWVCLCMVWEYTLWKKGFEIKHFPIYFVLGDSIKWRLTPRHWPTNESFRLKLRYFLINSPVQSPLCTRLRSKLTTNCLFMTKKNQEPLQRLIRMNEWIIFVLYSCEWIGFN